MVKAVALFDQNIVSFGPGKQRSNVQRTQIDRSAPAAS
jgi:hypothetical protein